YGAVSDEQTAETLRKMDADGYLCEPHGAIAYRILNEQLQAGETGLFLCTAHPAKFKEVVEDILQKEIDLPAPLAKHGAMELLSVERDNDFAQLKAVLQAVQD